MESKNNGRLAATGLIFPNVEMRFGISAPGRSPINFHLLVCPDDPNHVVEIRRFLLGLTFVFGKEEFRCERGDLIRLGRAYDNTATQDGAALAVGTNQFKVNRDQLNESLKRSDWAQKNILIAVAGSSQDGTSSLQLDASLTALRQELERAAHIIFASQPRQRTFWLGQGVLTSAQLVEKYGGCKPCLHGSDAHEQSKVGQPDQNRLCWLKGDVVFETLRQACLEPELRTFIGPSPLQQAMPSQTISAIVVTQAPWLAKPTLPINGGLVAIIGARGSGKTALADLIAAGGLALSSQMNEKSFIKRASKLIGEAKSCLVWGDGRHTENELKHVNLEEVFDIPHVQYLSQQFVDQLCSSEGVTDALLAEIERVIFQSHTPEARMGSVSFDELRQIKTASLRGVRVQEEATIQLCSRELILEQAKKDSLIDLRAQHSQLSANIITDKRDRQSFISKDHAVRGQELENASDALSYVRGQVDAWNRRNQQLTALRAEVVALRKAGAPSQLEQLKLRYPESGFSADQWGAFLLNYSGDVEALLSDSISLAVKNAASWRGPKQGELTPSVNTPPQPTSLIPFGVDLKQQTSTLLAAEVTRLQGLVGIDTANSKKYTALSAKIAKDEVSLAKLHRDIEAAEKADERIAGLVKQRSEAYRDVFDAILGEESALSELYDPLRTILELEDGALGKLGFSIRRSIDTRSWVKNGEDLFDLRNGPFRGKGTLLFAVDALGLEQSWQTGSADQVAAAMAEFRKAYGPSLAEHCPVDRRNKEDFRDWIGKVFNWLYDTSHISVTYGIQYDGVDIEQLSPGTRGIVLLLLYLTIDFEDDRPLIIDQPEENLDPQSIFDELVHRFKVTKLRRQIIIVTHNANLVVNTDADQVIIATAGSHRPGQLPIIDYCSGGLENADIRRQVCNILEGGETAFKERAKRLRVVL